MKNKNNLTIGQTVFTANAKTNTVDKWTFSGLLPSDGDLLCHLTSGTKYVFLPMRCVFETEEDAKETLQQ